MADWPLQNICEPHEWNDVLLVRKSKTILEQYPSTSTDDAYYEGNQRFVERLRARQEEYKLKSPMERPGVALELLKEWRNMSPPGRFLIVQQQQDDAASTNAPPLWRDVGDKEARSRISKTLKQLSTSGPSISATSSHEDSKEVMMMNSTLSGEEKKEGSSTTLVMEQQEQDIRSYPPHQGGEEDPAQAPTLRCQVSGCSSKGVSIQSTFSGEEKLESDGPLPRSVPASFSKEQMMLRHPLDQSQTQQQQQLQQIPIKQILPQSQIPSIKPLSKLGSRRISAQLQAANAQGKIYGRWEERQRLLQILKDSCSGESSGSSKKLLRESSSEVGSNKVDFVLIRGEAGVGKTAVARTFKNPMASSEYEDADADVKPSFFLEAKFEELRDPNPYKAFVEIFQDFCHQLLQDHNKHLVKPFREAILKAFGDEVDILITGLPDVETILFPDREMRNSTNSSADDDNDDRDGAAAKKTSPSGVLMAHKAKPFCVLFLQTIASLIPEQAIVLVLNDLHWASEASMDILTTLMSDVVVPDRTGLIFVATMYYGHCQQAKSYYERAMKKINARETIRVHLMDIQNLKETDVRDFLFDFLDCGTEKTLALSTMLFTLSKGNPMFLSEFLRKMQDYGHIYPHEISGEWTYDMSKMQQQFQNVGTFADMIKAKCDRMPSDVRKTIRYMAGLGSSKIDESILAMLVPDTLSSHLDFLVVQMGMLRRVDGIYRFAIDGVQHKIYNLMSETERAALHLEIAQKLWQHLDDRKDKEFLFILLNQLMRGDSTLKEDDDRRAVAALCLRAGETSARSLGFQTAWCYLEHGISILPKEKLWGRDNYDLSLRLHNAAIEVCYANGQYEKLHELIDEILEHSRIFEDSLLARSTQIYALGSRHQLTESIESALNTLKELGENLPPSPSSRQVMFSFQKTKRMLYGLSDDSIVRMKSIKDRKKMAAMQIMNHMFLYARTIRPYLASLVAHRMVQITLEFGVCEVSSVAFGFYSEFLVSGPSIEDGLRYGKLSLQLYERYKNEAWLCRVWTTYYSCVSICKEPQETSLEPLHQAYNMGMRTGDIEYAMLSKMQYCYCSMDTLPLSQLKAELQKVATDMELTGHTMALETIKPILSFVIGFSEGPDQGHRCEEVSALFGKECDLQLHEPSNYGEALWHQFVRMCLAYNFADFERALEFSKGVHLLYTKFGLNSIESAYVLFFECMVLLANGTSGCFRRFKYASYIKRRIKLLEKWAYMAPENLLDKQHLLMAELAAVQNKPKKACMHYRAGILHSRSQNRLGIEAIGTERLARFYASRGELDSALSWLDEACRRYEEWGAHAIVWNVQRYRDSLKSCSKK